MSILKSIGKIWHSIIGHTPESADFYYQGSDPNRPTWVYALIDPRDEEIRYIGQSVNPEARVAQHRQGGNRRVLAWLDELYAAGLKPTLKILEQTIADDCYKRERFWIIFYRDQGAPLLNITHVVKPVYQPPLDVKPKP